MKSPTSLIRIRYAAGMMLTLSAVFAVVLTAISVPSDNADAQVADADDAVTARAKAWFNSLTLDEAINALLGAGSDAVADVDGDATTTGRQYVDDATDANVIDLEIEVIHNAWVTKSATQSFYDGLPADSAASPISSGTVHQAAVKLLVDGNTTTTGDLYAVGDQIIVENFVGSTFNFQGIRGFQSVKLWWNHLTCVEARTAVGEDNVTLTAGATAADDPTSMYCEITRDADGNNPVVSRKGYDDLSADAKAQADEVGNALLGLTNGGTYSEADNPIAERWWNEFDAHIYTARALNQVLRLAALYGDGVNVGPARKPSDGSLNPSWIASSNLGYAEINDSYTPDDSPLDAADKALVLQTKALINDRAMLVYGSGGTGGKYEGVDVWWNSLDCLQKTIAIGEDNEPGTAGAGLCQDFDDLPGTPYSPSADNANQKPHRLRAMIAGRALLNLKPIPQEGAWWDTLTNDQRVNVVYGSPLATEDADTDPATPETPVASEADREAFQKMYADLSGSVVTSDLPATTQALTERQWGTSFVDETDDAQTREVKRIVDAIAREIFDPPPPLMAWVASDGSLVDAPSGGSPTTPTAPAANTEFDPPYQSVADWWEKLDCRTMRIAVGEDNNYLNAAVPDTGGGPPEPDTSMLAETSEYCKHFPGAAAENDAGTNVLGAEEQKRVVEVGAALLAREADLTPNKLHAGRPSFNEPAEGMPTISGAAQVGLELMSDPNNIDDPNGVAGFSYQWLRDGEPIKGATMQKYTLQFEDVGSTISVRYSFTDGGRYPESVTSLVTSTVGGSPGIVSRIEPVIRSVTLSASDKVVLAVDIYGLQNIKDNTLAASFEWTQTSGSNAPEDLDGSTREIEYTAPSSPGIFTIKATVGGGECQPKVEDDREAACSASITVQVRRPSPAVTEDQTPPVNPPGEIPTILTDSDGNQYEVITPVEGGTFDAGEGYSIHVPSGAVPNGEVIGVRMSAEGEASNVGMSHQRYTLGGNTYGIHVVDGSGATVSSTELEDPARVCVPLPDAFRTKISDLGLVGLNSDGSLTVYAANVRLGDQGTQVCGNVSGIPATVAVGSQGAPAPIPTEVPPEDRLPETGATAPSSNGALFALILGFAVLTLSTFAVIYRRRPTTRYK